MKILKKISPCEVCVEKEFSPNEIQKIEELIIKDKGKNLSLPGFRPGKSPKEKIKEKLILSGQWEELFSVELQKAFLGEWEINKKHYKLGDLVKISSLKVAKPDPLIIEFQCEFFPRIDLKDDRIYKNIKIKDTRKAKEITASDTEIEKSLDILQKRRTILKPVEGPLSEGKDAFIKVTFSGESDTLREVQDLYKFGSCEYGENFERQIKGMDEGEEKMIDVTHDCKKDKNSHSLEKFAVKENSEASINVKIEKIFVSEVPEINDEFAKSLGDFKNLGDLKESIAQGLRIEKLESEKKRREELMLAELIKKIKIEIPVTLIKNNSRENKKRLESKLKNDPAYSKKELFDKKRAELKDLIEKQVETELKKQRIIEAIALKEKIFPKDEEIELEIKRVLSNFSSPSEAKEVLGDANELKSKVILSLCYNQTFDFLAKENNIARDIDEEISKIERETGNGKQGTRS